MKRITILLLTVAVVQQIKAKPTIEWQKSFGGTQYENANDVQQTADGGYIFAASSPSSDGDLTTNKGGLDCWIVKISNAGVIEWQKSFGGSGDDEAKAIVQTADGGYAFTGTSTSSDGDVSGNQGGTDAWVVKLSSMGAVEWQKSYGGSGSDRFSAIKQTGDGGYFIGGSSYSANGDLSVNKGSADLWAIKLSSTGSIEWQKSLGGSTHDYIKSIDISIDGGYIVAGYTDSNDGDILTTHGSDEIWVMKLASTGTIEWQKFIGGSSGDFAWNVKHCADGGFVIAGSSNSGDGDLTVNLGSEDCFIMKLSATGSIEWKKSFGGSIYDSATSIYQTADGGFIVAATTNSTDGDVTANFGNYDFWLVKLDALGNIEWKKSLGGSMGDAVFSVIQTTDGGLMVIGNSQSTDGDLTANKGMDDVWVVKLSSIQSIGTLENENLLVYPNPVKESLTLRNCLKATRLEVQNVHGQAIYFQPIDSDEIEIRFNGELSSGVYVLRVFEGENLRAVRKIIIE